MPNPENIPVDIHLPGPVKNENDITVKLVCTDAEKEHVVMVNLDGEVTATALQALGMSLASATSNMKILLGGKIDISEGTFADNQVEDGATIFVVPFREKLTRLAFPGQHDDDDGDDDERVTKIGRIVDDDRIILVGGPEPFNTPKFCHAHREFVSNGDGVAVSTTPALSICGEIVNLEVTNDLVDQEDEMVAIGACLTNENFNHDDAVLWVASTGGHHHAETYSNVVLIGKNVSATGSAVQYNMPGCLKPEKAIQLRLNSRRELLFKLKAEGEEEQEQWLNVTPGGLKEDVSELHLVTSCYNSYDVNTFDSFEEMETYIKVHLDLEHSDEAIEGADREYAAQCDAISAIQAENARCTLPLVASRHCQLSVNAESTEATMRGKGIFYVKTQSACFFQGTRSTAQLTVRTTRGMYGSLLCFGVCSKEFNVDFFAGLPQEQMYYIGCGYDESDPEVPSMFAPDWGGVSYSGSPVLASVDDEEPSNLCAVKVADGGSVEVRLTESCDAVLYKSEGADEWTSVPLPEDLVQSAQSEGLHLLVGAYGPVHVCVRHAMAGGSSP